MIEEEEREMQAAAYNILVEARGTIAGANRGMVLLGNRDIAESHFRVMDANKKSSLISPADLDAFLQGYLNPDRS